MLVSGFIVVAACVMTFEARDRAAKFMSNQLKIMGGGAGVGGTGVGAGGTMSGHRGHGRQTPSGGYLSRGDSGRSSYQNPCDAGWHKMNKSPSAPNLAGVNRGPGSAVGAGRLPFRHKHAVHHVLSPGGGGGGRTLLSPHTLRRQAMSMDTQDYNPFFSPPRSRHSSSGLLSCNNGNSNNNGGGGGNNNNSNSNNNNNIDKQGSCSRESVNDPRARGSHGSMVLDLHVPNECPITMRVRDRSRRSDTARRHVLRRQTPVELDDAIIAYAATAAADHRQRAKRCTRSATCDVPHVVKSKRRRQDSSCSDVVTRRRSGSPVYAGGYAVGDGAGGWRSSANDVVDSAERARTAGRSGSRGSAVSSSSSPQRATAGRQGHRTAVPGRSSPVPPDGAASAAADSKMSLSRTCSDIVSIDKSFEEESNYSSS